MSCLIVHLLLFFLYSSVIPEEREQYETVAMQNNAYDTMTAMGQSAEKDAVHYEPPSFLQPIVCSNTNLAEGDRTRFIGEVSLVGDSTLQIEWLKDGQPIVIGTFIAQFVL